MLPAHIAQNIRRQILYYLQSTFSFRDKKVEGAFQRFLEDPESGIYKGPWVQLKRPFRPAPEGVAMPFDIEVPFHPFLHQYRAWKRLSAKSGAARNTIVTTGTGSGKTECFLFPILDHCLRTKKQGQSGIKAIILYPMNALAADQEKRFAAAIWDDPALKSAGIRVGNYTGRYDPADPGKSQDSGYKEMGPGHGITNHEAQQENPPDILLTNYRMLDFLLMRPQDKRLWRFNGPDVLKYLVLDELHTYDGAQGADVACLIRRLKDRLSIPTGRLCVVGTSATLDDRELLKEIQADGSADAAEAGKDRLAAFAATLFEEEIPVEAVIGEDRLSVEQIVHSDLREVAFPNPQTCHPLEDEDSLRYVIRQSQNWGGPVCEPASHENGEGQAGQSDAAIEQWELELGHWLKHRVLFKYLLEVFHAAEIRREDPLAWTELVDRLTRKDFGLQAIDKAADRQIVVASFCSLVAHARELRSKRSSVLVPTQVQLWIRELRRLGRIVSRVPVFAWLDEPVPNTKSLPAFHCSECGESGWVALHDPDQDSQINSREVSGWAMESDPSRIYRGWFGTTDQQSGVNRKSQYIFVISPDDSSGIKGDEPALRQMPLTALDAEDLYFCPESLVIRRGDGPCPLTGDTRNFKVRVSNATRRMQNGQVVGAQRCPRCGSAEGLFFIGAQSAILASVAIDEMFGSILNSDPKLLAFTDSVQDASHRAGFFSSRTYHFTFRTALQHVVNAGASGGGSADGIGGAHNGLKLTKTGRRLFDYWSREEPGRPGSVRETMTALMPPDLHDYKPFRDFRNNPALAKPPSRLLDEITRRLTWQAISEFGLMQTHGRTMELNGSACLGWDETIISDTIRRLQEKLPGINPVLARIDDDHLRIWIYGMLHRYRERGGLYHSYLDAFARHGFWGKYPVGRIIEGRETYPSAIRYKPKLLVTTPQRDHEHVLAHTRGGQQPWHIRWAYRALGEPAVLEADIIDAIQAFLICGNDAGLLMCLHKDGSKDYYAISSEAAWLVPHGICLACDETDRYIVRPEPEANFWKNAPSMEYYATRGRYVVRQFDARQRYYQDRYHKGALRRVVAEEHTGLLATEEREKVETCFKKSEHADDPNVLTCTSTLEMGIDIGDLSSTMLCSIPPNTASYLQRIGRAGRATGTALIVSVVNQRPHDLFFYARPMEMLKGKVDPPGCWLDASAVLVRQYLGYCFDSATREDMLNKIPTSCGQLVEDLNHTDGHIPAAMAWVTANEMELQNSFLRRYRHTVQEDTRQRFLKDTDTQLLIQKMHQATQEFDRMQRDLDNARKRLNDQLSKLDTEEKDARIEIQRELRIIKARRNSLSRTTTLELFTDHGLLPNYAFPERGVRFYGAIYNKHRHADQEYKPVEIYRNATSALKELAPYNTFYTHRRQFDVQQIVIGNPQQLLTESWAVCGLCGHMRRLEELSQPDANPACPQCGHSVGRGSQLEIGQHRQFIEFSQSQALSYMEHYESLSGDRDEERQRGYYDVIASFDQTKERSAGAVGDDSLPFGIEYRSSMILRVINTGYLVDQKDIPFGPDTFISDEGFQICQHCGIAIPPHLTPQNDIAALHRRSCQGRRKAEKLRQEGKDGQTAFQYLPLYLYRQLKSEAIRLLLPLADGEDVDTLVACIYLGLRLRFEGNPAHLIVQPQIMPEPSSGITKHYLVIMDAVPGGTGFLKALYQEKDDKGREGEGIMDVLRRARDTLETCPCRKFVQQDEMEDTDGCYRCIRTYHLQYKADQISRERGIKLLSRLIESGAQRVDKRELEQIKADSLYGSVLEKKFVDALRSFVEDRKGSWSETIIKGSQGFRFSLPDSERLWELELQPSLGAAQGVLVQSQPDFLLSCDDDGIKPVAIFSDGFEYHCFPNNRLADDMNKRRAILESGNYRVWGVTWEDVTNENQTHEMVCHPQLAGYLVKYQQSLSQKHKDEIPHATKFVGNGMQQLKAFLSAPSEIGWKLIADYIIFHPLLLLADKRKVKYSELQAAFEGWRMGGAMSPLSSDKNGEWIYNDRASLTQDFIAYITTENAIIHAKDKAGIIGRLGDSEQEVSGSDYKERWRRFLACINAFQFTDSFSFWTSSEAMENTAPEIVFEGEYEIAEGWKDVLEETISRLKPVVEALAKAGLPIPKVEFTNDDIDDDAFAELAWEGGNGKIVILAGDQQGFANQWQNQGWRVTLPDEIEIKGVDWLIDEIRKIA
ncbi:DEAD/DEAH box helicase [Desulfosarcina ovata subsp. sediminis]|uniref:DEAD/DEAH box helicase n=1 Tax=Desulfosarcina ovata subsp. sediminis TaxID=885957 RepID=A0A5K7ZZ78_9BACT|nr:DEAD/DEAH box helicase [Desulfosarcina ovata]BBO85595.1 DEAD/DEAH box helicase [Desulfosarcina ovata subsp. sediminis]